MGGSKLHITALIAFKRILIMIKINNDFFAVQCDLNKYIIFNADTHKIFVYNGQLDSFSAPSKANSEICKSDQVTELKCKDQLIGLTLCVSERCNLACKYCYANGGAYDHSAIEQDMNAEDMKKVFHELLLVYPKGILNYTFFGGEPMLAFSAVKEFSEYVAEESEKIGLDKPHFSIVTNGTLITKEAWDFFNKMNFNVSISIDGNKSENDTMRVFAHSDKSVYDVIARNLTSYGKRSFFLVAEATLGVAFFKNYTSGSIRDYLKTFDDLGFDAVSPFVAESAECDLSDPEIVNGIKMFYSDLVDYSFEILLSDDRWSKTPTYILSAIINIIKKKSKRTCTAGKESLFYTKKGKFYPCQMYYSGTDQSLGCISDIEALKITVSEKKRCYRSDIQECQECFARNFCTLWCPGGSYLFCGDEMAVAPIRCLVQKAIGKRIIEQLVKVYNSDKNKIFVSNLRQLSQRYSWNRFIEDKGVNNK